MANKIYPATPCTGNPKDHTSININEEKFDRFLNINTKKDLEKAKENLDKI